MPNTQMKQARNQSIECCKLVAAIFVVFIHARFPGDLGAVMDCLARFAVPMFFAVSGYFNYQADSAKIGRRMKHILKLNLIAIVVYLLWDCFTVEYYGGSTVWYLRDSIVNMDALMQWVILHVNPFAAHLWYLTAIGVCYLVFWVYTRCRGERRANYSALYVIGFLLFAVCFVLDTVLPVLDIYVPYQCCRNGWFIGLPMFTMGIFLHEYQERILAKLHLSAVKLVLLVLAGAALSVLQWRKLLPSEIPLGTYLEVTSLILLLVSNPTVAVSSKFAQTVISKFGFLSTAIYILHMLFVELYEMFIQQKLFDALEEKEAYLKPVLVAVLSLAAAVLCVCASDMSKRTKCKQK